MDDTISLSDAVFACPPEWQKQFITLQGLDAVAGLCPVHLAVQKSVEAGGKKTAWHVPFQTASQAARATGMEKPRRRSRAPTP